MADSLPRKHASLLIQLCTGHAPLNKHLFNMKCTDSPVCPACKDAYKTMHHFLLSCPVYEHHRHTLFFTLKRGSRLLPLSSRTQVQSSKFSNLLAKHGASQPLGDLDLPDTLDTNSGGRNWNLDLLNRPFMKRVAAEPAPGSEET